MAVEIWPSTLPQQPQKGYSESKGMNIIRSSMDAGPAKQRRRSANPGTLDVSWILTTAQLSDLDTFIETNLGGVKRFKFPHPRLSTYATQSTWKEVRIVPSGAGELYKVQYLTPGYWQVSANLEILP
jgi:hypothetical protein